MSDEVIDLPKLLTRDQVRRIFAHRFEPPYISWMLPDDLGLNVGDVMTVDDNGVVTRYAVVDRQEVASPATGIELKLKILPSNPGVEHENL